MRKPLAVSTPLQRQRGAGDAREVGGAPGRRSSDRNREEISRGVAETRSFAEIARGLGRPTSTVSREVARNAESCRYRAWRTQADTRARCRRRRLGKLLARAELRRAVEAALAERWSPAQVSARLRLERPDDPLWRVSHEAIYRSLYVQGGGGLRNELHRALPTGRAQRVPRGHGRRGPGARIPDMVLIAERPPDVDDRAVPGHWEGRSTSVTQPMAAGEQREHQRAAAPVLPKGH